MVRRVWGSDGLVVGRVMVIVMCSQATLRGRRYDWRTLLQGREEEALPLDHSWTQNILETQDTPNGDPVSGWELGEQLGHLRY